MFWRIEGHRLRWLDLNLFGLLRQGVTKIEPFDAWLAHGKYSLASLFLWAKCKIQYEKEKISKKPG